MFDNQSAVALGLWVSKSDRTTGHRRPFQNCDLDGPVQLWPWGAPPENPSAASPICTGSPPAALEGPPAVHTQRRRAGSAAVACEPAAGGGGGGGGGGEVYGFPAAPQSPCSAGPCAVSPGSPTSRTTWLVCLAAGERGNVPNDDGVLRAPFVWLRLTGLWGGRRVGGRSCWCRRHHEGYRGRTTAADGLDRGGPR